MDDDFINAGESVILFSNGDRFKGYIIEHRIGHGAVGEVYLVRHEMLDTLYALKVLTASDTVTDGEMALRFVREAKIAARIQHPNLVRVHDAGFDDSTNVYYLVMDYMSKGTLRDRIAFEGVIPHQEAVEIIYSIASALDAGARMGLVHRDLKPENIMFSENGIVKLVDLGIAKVCDENTLHTRTSASFGTPAYVAPEQAKDASKVDSRADIYSLGVILFEMLCGRRPYAGDTPMAIISQVISDEPLPDVKRLNPDVPNWVSALVFRMCAKNPEKRISSAAELVSTISKYLNKRADKPDYAVVPEKNPFEMLRNVGNNNESALNTYSDKRNDFYQKLLPKVLLLILGFVLLTLLIIFI